MNYRKFFQKSMEIPNEIFLDDIKKKSKEEQLNMIIGTMGLEFGSGNKGCEALGFAFFYMLNQIAVERNEIIDVKICMGCDTARIVEKIGCSNLKLSCTSVGKITEISRKKQVFKDCDLVYDFSAGDSFADIYGLKRFLRWTMNKQAVLWAKRPLILGSQTYGPYKSFISKFWAGHVIKDSYRVYARDDLSQNIAGKLSGRSDIHKTVDVAFSLPYDKMAYNFEKNGKIRVGFNPSGLLWAGGYNRNNQFALTLDYKKYCTEIIKELIKTGKYDVYLISHVLYEDLSCADNDIVVCNELKKLFPKTIVSPWFDTPMDAKGYIANMDVFIGARMHATIGAFTSGVATIPLSYSRKFEGLYNSVGYPYVISGTKIATGEALSSTFEYISRYKELAKMIQEKKKNIDSSISYLLESIRSDLRDLDNE